MTHPMKYVIASVFLVLSAGCNQGPKFDLPSSEENYQQEIEYSNKVDILFIVDNSQSMKQYQDLLNMQTAGLIDSLDRARMDYHIAVITTSMSGNGGDPNVCVVNGGHFIGTPRVLTPATKNVAELLTERIGTGDKGCINERGLDSMTTVFQPSYLAGEGTGFLREDAVLAVVALSNEDDKSTDYSTEELKEFMDQLKPAFKYSQGWLFNFVGVLSITSKCSTLGGYKEAGLKFMDLVDYTSGVKASVCTESLEQAVSNIRQRLVNINAEFKLGKVPDVKNMQVFVDSVEVMQDEENGWTYNSENISIQFHGTSIPKDGAKVYVKFKNGEAT